ncbi:2-succinyl-6-hydroxy-2,4-cyclohexadiene-1-carboxylate synthase [Vallitalea sp.]|jgi:2-succinyl-6-hydroxy-2,4-cyclohexadiene-1-carboxylate synthase|uniref:2-succinyl-6-hydroxy-2, 4-cyclohexadiene-1-carboxylate synthase n=1 Tax=Vallitalea sp. TaxID=1882829 RepID=UPI0025D5B530|nr:2-succinyl-6-hydroxy-2,4-cyclohexadiene-1-carboxylate synthase [Vallitalea sp.]MCT4687851.1 2-succinyl-6-hydroxy-2,4-cyclohexadiene-1-carboxylate synthase [Vallitalea sp.]
MKIKYDDINYNVEVEGNGIPMVFLHGFSENISTFRYLDCIGYKRIFIDLIGHGKTQSPKDMKYYNVKYLVKAINYIINTITDTKYILYGYSMGGRIALAYAFLYQEELSHLILESSSYGIEDESMRNKRYYSDCRLAEDIRYNGIEWFESYWSNISIFETQKMLKDDVRNAIKKIRLSNNIQGLSNSLIGFSQGRINCLKSELYKLNIGVTFISGELDKKYTSIGEELTELIRNINHVRVESSGHNVHMEKTQSINKLLHNIRQTKIL